MMQGKKSLDDVLKNSKSLLIGGSLLPDQLAQANLASKDFIVVQELFETATTEFADVVLPAASFAEIDGTYTNNDGLVQRVRQSIAPINQAKDDWMITSMIARELGVDFGYNFSAPAVFRAIADSIAPYKGLRYPNIKDETKPVQVKHPIAGKQDLSSDTEVVRQKVEAMPDEAVKFTKTPKVGHKLHQAKTLTGKTPQFHLLQHGNPKPENLLVSPLMQFNLDGTPRLEELAETAAVGVSDRLDDKESVREKVILKQQI
jgi:anaerobic selenocysteine-containing dehydrogenase